MKEYKAELNVFPSIKIYTRNPSSITYRTQVDHLLIPHKNYKKRNATQDSMLYTERKLFRSKGLV